MLFPARNMVFPVSGHIYGDVDHIAVHAVCRCGHGDVLGVEASAGNLGIQAGASCHVSQAALAPVGHLDIARAVRANVGPVHGGEILRGIAKHLLGVNLADGRLLG